MTALPANTPKSVDEPHAQLPTENSAKIAAQPGPGKGSESADSAAAKVAKLVPADLTAAFLSVKAGLEAAMRDTGSDKFIFWTFIALVVLCPFYFRYVNKVKDRLHIWFLTATFVVFASSIAYTDFSAYLGTWAWLAARLNVDATLTAIAVVLPILWAFIVAPTILEKLKEGDLE
jgi:hypothetical protein